ncbi:MAG: hypothetical protein P1U53_04520 [Sulfitobacter sp.]|nr:hypothetical protein [Sulfitobacter sp.]
MKGAAFACALVLAPPAFAATQGEEDAMAIVALGGNDFEVIETRSMGAADFWCGAGTFVERRQGLSGLTPIYVKRGRGPSQSDPARKSVVFTLDRSGLPQVERGRTLTVSQPGSTLKATFARRYCRDAFTRSTK